MPPRNLETKTPILMGDLKARRVDCAKGDNYGIYSAISTQTSCIHQNIYLFQTLKSFDQIKKKSSHLVEPFFPKKTVQIN